MFPVTPQGDENRDGAHPSFISPKHIVIAAGGVEPSPGALRSQLGEFECVIAADGGWRLLQAAGLPCHLLIGDFDTLRAEEVDRAAADGAEVRRFPAAKAKSDLELAIECAVEFEATHISFIGALGGQVDHCLTNFLSPLSHCSDLGLWARLLTSESEVYLTTKSVSLRAPRRRVSLVSLSRTTKDLSLEGFEYPLSGATLHRARTLGLANRAVEAEASITFSSGELFVTLQS